MCLAALKLPDQEIPGEYIREAMRSNPHGAGIAYAKNDRVCIVKGIWSADSAIKILRRLKRYPVAFHARYATHGKVSRANCHPFRIADDCAAIHNGMIAGYGSDNYSDTRHFVEEELVPCHEVGILRDKSLLDEYASMVGSGNKIVILHGDGEANILNESSGHWEDDVWYSNHSYLPWISRPYASYSSSVWDDWDDEPEYSFKLASDGRWEQTSLGKFHYVPGSKKT